ncbi:hypothetical protein FOA52_000621 [Chlamydomonas sp. UWO 241]|nr:hypothetical protein FOA52_000621 [Chlamydomonas sp. UWO 241]
MGGMAGRGAGGRGRRDYLDFDWDTSSTGSGDDLADGSKYEDFLKQEQRVVRAPERPFVNPYGNNNGSYSGGGGGYGYNARRRTMSRPLNGNSWGGDRYDQLDEDDYDYFDEEPGPPPPRVTEKRYLNGKHVLTNTEITAPLLRLIGAAKEQIGMKPLEEALRMANGQDMDLILINPEQAPPVARIIQWSKYKFELEQGVKERKSKATIQETKEVRLKPKTDDHDLDTKARMSAKFLEKGDKVKVTMRFEGRQLQFKEQGKEVLLKFIDDIGEAGKIEGPLNFKSGTYTVMMVPSKQGGGGGGGGGGGASSKRDDDDAPSAAAAPSSAPPAGAPPPLPQSPASGPAGAAPPLPPRPMPPAPPAAAPAGAPGAAPPGLAPHARPRPPVMPSAPGSAPPLPPPLMPQRPMGAPMPPVSRPPLPPSGPRPPPMPLRPVGAPVPGGRY